MITFLPRSEKSEKFSDLTIYIYFFLERCFALLKQNLGKSKNRKLEGRKLKQSEDNSLKSYLALSFRNLVVLIPLCTSWKA